MASSGFPNYISFALNPDNDVINLATTPFFATLDHGITPVATLDESGCTFTPGTGGAPGTLTGCTPGPFQNGILPPPGRNAIPNTSNFVAANGNPTLAPYTDPKYGYVQQFNLDIQRQLGAGFFVDVAYAGAHGVHLQQYSTNIDQIPDSYIAQAEAQSLAGQPVTIDQSIPNPMISPNPSIGNGPTQSPTILKGQLDRPYPQYTGLSLGGFGCCGSTYNSLQATVTRRFQGGGTLLVAYTNSKLLSNTDSLTSWLELANETGGIGQVQDYNNLNAERSLSSQDVSQRLVISYVLDLPFGHGKTWLNGASGVEDKVVSGWGIDGVTTFQRGFPLKLTWAGPSTPLEGAGLGIGNIRPDVVAGCSKGGNRSLTEWFNVNCFAAPPAWGYGTESRVDSSLRAAGINNFDFAIFKTHADHRKVRYSIPDRVLQSVQSPPVCSSRDWLQWHLYGHGEQRIRRGDVRQWRRQPTPDSVCAEVYFLSCARLAGLGTVAQPVFLAFVGVTLRGSKGCKSPLCLSLARFLQPPCGLSPSSSTLRPGRSSM